ncbi:uncharacterized protein J8A68_001503 [[Candida] subhashii]|uniref:RNI-like protein n=1 Tax=[Candida] subhashii TaxID=561895 RepID=A0A8J5R378_9ASCO|nr:uncharacterized protein J8A68_001503 [[Candida] subhashii]KAG7664975.1 hypothetical protein J8A68_001503 [[Candida] subhashii]
MTVHNRSFIPDNPSPLASRSSSNRVKHTLPRNDTPTTSISSNDNSDEDDDYSYDDINEDSIHKTIPREFFNRLIEFPLFSNAPKSFHTKIVSELKLMQYHPQEFIIKTGQCSKSMYWILKGVVSVTSSPDGESVYAELASGSFFGEIGILYNRPRTATVVAKTRVLVGVLTAKALNMVLRNYPSIERRIRDEAQERLAMQEKKKRNNKYQDESILPQGKHNLQYHQQQLQVPLDEKGYNASMLASQASIIPGPHVPSLLTTPSSSYPSSPNTSSVEHLIVIQDFIRSLPIFQNLPRDIIHQLALGVEPLSISQPYEDILHKGDDGSNIYFIIDGEVEVFDYAHDGESNRYPFIVEDMRSTAEARRNNLNSLQNDDSNSEEEIFTPNWTFQKRHKSVSPSISISRSPSPDFRSIQPTPSSFPAKLPPITTPTTTQKRRRSVDIDIPPTSIDNFQAFHTLPKPKPYIPHKRRRTLAQINPTHPGRRRSSILANCELLPDKLTQQILQYLPLTSMMRFRLVSKKWRHLLHMIPLPILDLKPWNTLVDDKALISITDFVGCRPEIIDISNCFHITDEGFSYMINEIGISGKIKTIRMVSNWEVSAMAIMDLSVAHVGRYLEEIDLSNCRKVRDDVLERLIGWGEEEEEVPGVGVDELVGCKRLKVLNLGYCKHLTDSTMKHIAMQASDRIEVLDITRCTLISDLGFEYWQYRNFSNLKSLILKDCTFLTDKAMFAIANSAKNLETLNLDFCCSLTDLSIEVLSLGCPKLRQLNFSFCGSAISDSSLVTISLNLAYLERLILKGCIRVTRAGVDALLSGISPRLNYLDISQCKNAHIYPGNFPAQQLTINPQTKSAFVSAGPYNNITEIVL